MLVDINKCKCRVCGVALTPENRLSYIVKKRERLCTKCYNEIRRLRDRESVKKCGLKHRRIKAEILSDVGWRCAICGLFDPCQDVYDLHHMDIASKDGRRTMAYYMRNRTDKKAKEEMKKCVVLCANCHRRLHALAGKHTSYSDSVRAIKLLSGQVSIHSAGRLSNDAEGEGGACW